MLEHIRKDPVLYIAGLLAAASCFIVHPDKQYLDYIDLRVLAILFGMMLVVSELVQLGVFARLADKLLSKTGSSRMVSLILVYLSFFMGMILTNDVTLVTLVPFAITLMKKEDLRRDLVFTLILMTVATNLGSMQTPIGNPQNIYLFTHYQMHIGSFMFLVLPYSVCSLILVTIGVFALCRDKKITREMSNGTGTISGVKLALCIALFILCILVVLRVVIYPVMLMILIPVMLIADHKAFKGVDYSLIITFVFFFVFVGNMGRIDAIYQVISGITSKAPVLACVALSQVISNVPAALLLSQFTDNAKALVIGTNIGGLGTLIASMASLITYKFHCSLPKTQGKQISYIGAFTLINLTALIVLSALYLILS